MKTKFTLLFFLSCFMLCSLHAQVIFEDNFDSYTNGDRVAAAANNAFWDTWSSSPGTSEDGIVSEAQAVSGSNSMYISGTTTDVLLRLNETPFTTGRYIVDFKMFVEHGKYGYYNLLHFFDGSNSSWSTQSYFRPDSMANADAGAGDVVQWNQPTGEWFDVRYVIDLDDDFCTYYQDGNEMVSWKWSTGTFGSSNELSLEAVNFYAWAEGGGQAGYYIDDVRIEQVDKPGSVLNLNAVLNMDNQVEIDWSSSPDAIQYILTNHGANIAETTDTTSFIAKPYPQEFSFRVGAHIENLGYRFSEIASLELAGGIDRDFVLLEVGTGTWCPNCPSAARGVDQMHEEGYNVGILEYHESGGDPFIVPDGSARVDYYAISGFPTTYSDGVVAQVGGSFTGNDYGVFLGAYNNRMNRRALYNFDMTLTDLGNREYSVTVSSEELYDYFEGPIYLRIGLTESDIAYSWQGLSELDFVLRDMYPDAQGTEMDFDGTAQTFSYTFQLPEDFNADHCEIVGFLQHDDTKEVLTGDVIKVSEAKSSVNETLSATVTLVPNPVVNTVSITGLTEGNATIYDETGRQVQHFTIESTKHQEDLSRLSAGSYVLEVKTKQGIVSKQIIKL